MEVSDQNHVATAFTLTETRPKCTEARGFLDFWSDLKVLRDKSLPGIEPQFLSCLAHKLITMPDCNVALNFKEWFPWVLKLAYMSVDWTWCRSFLLAVNSCVILWRCSYSHCNHSYAFFAQFVCNGRLDLRRRPCLIVRPRVLSWKPLQILMKFDINVTSFKAVQILSFLKSIVTVHRGLWGGRHSSAATETK